MLFWSDISNSGIPRLVRESADLQTRKWHSVANSIPKTTNNIWSWPEPAQTRLFAGTWGRETWSRSMTDIWRPSIPSHSLTKTGDLCPLVTISLYECGNGIFPLIWSTLPTPACTVCPLLRSLPTKNGWPVSPWTTRFACSRLATDSKKSERKCSRATWWLVMPVDWTSHLKWRTWRPETVMARYSSGTGRPRSCCLSGKRTTTWWSRCSGIPTRPVKSPPQVGMAKSSYGTKEQVENTNMHSYFPIIMNSFVTYVK